ncbi:MAG: universal stress protein [Ginsengibacter sp.]
MNHILVPTDFSVASSNACEYAASLAQSFGAKITLVHVFAPPLVIDDISASSLVASHDELVERFQDLLESEIQIISKKYQVEIDTIVREGFADDMIPKMAHKRQADVIIMGMKGKGMSNSIFGSTAISVIRKTNSPVLLIPENSIYTSITRIGLAADLGSDSEINRYALLCEIAQKNNSLITIFNVQKEGAEMNLGENIGKMKTSLNFSKLKTVFSTIIDTNVVRGICRFMKENPEDVLVMIAHRHNFFERMFGKVHTKEMSYHTKIPLLVLHDQG